MGSSDSEFEGGFVFVTPTPEERSIPRQKGGGEKYNKEEHEAFKEEVAERDLDVQIKSVASSIKTKEIRDANNLYLVTETVEEPKPSKVYASLKRLSATVHAYLDENHHKILISVPEETLTKFQTKKLPMKIKEPLLKFRELSKDEQISKTLQGAWSEESREVVFHIMPNVDLATNERYISEISHFLEQRNSVVSWRPLDQGMIVSKTRKDVIESLLLSSNYIFKIHEVPKPVASKIRTTKRLERIPRPVASSIASTSQAASLPLVCVADSGVNLIPQLAGLVDERKSMSGFVNEDDEGAGDGHGTPIAYLTSFGETTLPRARIVSYKIYSDLKGVDSFRGMIEAIERYSGRCKIFVSSINFEDDVLPLYAKLDNLIQKKNICFVSSAGNILPEILESLSGTYPAYCSQFKVQHPAQNIHVIGVGSIARKANGSTIAPLNGLSPFSRCGESLPRLYDSKKPDIVEHGGNMTRDAFDRTGLGVLSYCKNGSQSNDLLGTSFSAPLVAWWLAQIYSKFAFRLTNAETFKAILFMSCKTQAAISSCVGFGLPETFLRSNHDEATFVSEGTVGLSDLSEPSIEKRFSKRIRIFVPEGVRRIDMCVVHSDDFEEVTEPSLDTYLQVTAHKHGRPSSPVPCTNNAVIQNKKVYAKFLTWEYPRRDMGATWDFEITPYPTREIDPRLRKNVAVRFGCVIIITRKKPRVYPLTDKVKEGMHNWEGVQFA
jgi:hypothetical protein